MPLAFHTSPKEKEMEIKKGAQTVLPSAAPLSRSLVSVDVIRDYIIRRQNASPIQKNFIFNFSEKMRRLRIL
jgi:hypothetical protein